ncbi:MAG: pyruvate ferredoxin oxidoreductase subunit gamma [Terriglobia bacterium]
MQEIRIHGRGGQGNVTAADLLAVAIFEDGCYTQAFPFFGSERMGAPVTAFVRVDDHAIRARGQVQYPDFLIVQDPTLVGAVNLFEGLKKDGVALVNSEKGAEELNLDVDNKVVTVPAFKIAEEVIGRPIPNTVLIGSFAAATGIVSLGAIQSSITARFGGKIGEVNSKAAKKGFEYVKETV